MEEKTYCVYRIYNKVEDKCYIGCTYNFERRIREHKKGNKEWQIDFATHPENWIVTILEDNISDKEAQYKEVYYIDLYDAIDNGYNKIRHGNSTTLEARKKLSISISGENNPNYGKHFSEQTRHKISESSKRRQTFLGKHHSEETRRKMSESHKDIFLGKNNPMYGKHHPEETRRKMSESHKNISEETRKKISVVSKGNIWINNGINTKRIPPDDLQKYIDLGYQKGRKLKE